MFKVGDKIKYIGPPRGQYQNPLDHPSAYMNHVVREIKPPNGILSPEIQFALIFSDWREHPEVGCCSRRYLREDEWEVQN